MNHEHVIGIDVGGTTITAARVSHNGTKHATHTCPTGNTTKEVSEHLKEAIQAVQTTPNPAIGIGTPGFVHDDHVASNPNVNGLSNALNKLRKQYETVQVENDANCFALAEHRWGAGQNTEDMIGLIWGTGIGAGIIANNQLITGVTGGAGEVGHIATGFDRDDFCPGCPGTWEHLCSGPNIIRRYHEQGGDQTVQRPDELLDKDEDTAKQVLDTTIHYMSVGIGNLVNTLNPELVVLGGGVSNLDVYPELNKELRENAVTASAKACEIVPNECGDDSGVLGAAAQVFDT